MSTEHRVVRPDPGDGRGPSREFCACRIGADHDEAGVLSPLLWPAREVGPRLPVPLSGPVRSSAASLGALESPSALEPVLGAPGADPTSGTSPARSSAACQGVETAPEAPREGSDPGEVSTGRSPKRVRVAGDLFHGRVPEGAVYVGRAAPGLKESPYANPFRVGHRAVNPQTGHEVIVTDRDVAVGLYGLLLAARECTDPAWVDQACADLEGRDLACWCPPGPCHVEPLLVFVNGGAA